MTHLHRGLVLKFLKNPNARTQLFQHSGQRLEEAAGAMYRSRKMCPEAQALERAGTVERHLMVYVFCLLKKSTVAQPINLLGNILNNYANYSREESYQEF